MLQNVKPDFLETNVNSDAYVKNRDTATVAESTAQTYTIDAGQATTPVITVADALTLNAGAVANDRIAYAEIVLDVAAGATVVAGTGITFADTIKAGERNICIVRWQDGSARLYCSGNTQIQSDWDCSDSTDPSYVKGNPTKENGKGFNIKSSDGWSQIQIPKDKTGISGFGLTQGVTIIKGGELQLLGDGSKGISWTKVDNDINITCNNIKKSGNMPNTAGGFAIVDSSTGKLPTNIVPVGDEYTDATSYSLTKNKAWRIFPSSRQYYEITSMSSGDWVNIEVVVTGSWLSGDNNADNIQIQYEAGQSFYLGSHDPRCRAQRGRFHYRITYDGSYYYLLNGDGGIIQKQGNNTYPEGIMPFMWYASDYQASDKMYHPISNDYAQMPFGGFVSPLVDGGDIGMGFDTSVSGQTLRITEGGTDMNQKYLSVHSHNPYIFVGDNTIEDLQRINTTLEPMLVTIIGGSSGHCYLDSGSTDLLASSCTFQVSGMKVCQVWTGCYWDGNYWQRYFKTVIGGVTDSYYASTLPAEQ